VSRVASFSIRRRLLALLLIPTAAIAALATYSAYRTSLAPFEAAYDQDLLDAALAIASNIEAGRGARPALSLTADAVKVLRSNSQDSIYYRVSGGDGRFIAGDAGLPVPHQRIRNPSFVDAVYGREPIREANYRVVTPAGAAIVTVAETLHKRVSARQRVLESSLAVDAAQLVTALIVIWFGVRLAIDPLRRVERQLSARRAGDLEPLTVDGVPLEIRSLIDALNRLLLALRESEQAERTFLENAAHQLRTPLAGMLAHLELMADDPNHHDRSQLRSVLEAGRRLARTAHQLLSLAHTGAIAHAATDLNTVSLPAVIQAVVARQLVVAELEGIELEAQINPAQIFGVRWLLEEALTNLVENAIAATPRGGSITLRCGFSGTDTFLDVSDTGVGIPEPERSLVCERFYRASNSRVSGSGLGLAIVREVAEIHGATFAITVGVLGRGTAVRLGFPRMDRTRD
jgi:two-component system, OmpR family, sensor histidine kinase TctE